MATLRLSKGLRNEIIKAGGSSLADALADGIIAIYGNTMPAAPESTEGASPLVLITLASGAFTGGVSTNGINFDVAANGIVSKAVSEVWSGVGLVAGVPLWGRFYSNAYTTGATDTGVHFDFDIGSDGSGAFLEVTANVSVGTTFTIDSASLTCPVSGS